MGEAKGGAVVALVLQQLLTTYLAVRRGSEHSSDKRQESNDTGEHGCGGCVLGV